MGKNNSRSPWDPAKVLAFLAICILFAFLADWFYAQQGRCTGQFGSILAVASMLSGAGLMVGGFFGFLFGIPKAPQHDSKQDPSSSSYGPNTNLEQISDWLTKILVGVGLVEINKLSSFVPWYMDFAGRGLGHSSGNKAFAFFSLAYSLVCGFMVGWLVTRLWLPKALGHADEAARLEQIEKKVSDREEQDALSVEILKIVENQLNAAPDAAPVPQREIDEALTKASRTMTQHVFYLAYRARNENWKTDKPKMQRTIPIFRGLIAADIAVNKEEKYHANHAQLGFALKDQTRPEWEEAARELSTAIQIRDKRAEPDYLLYEFNLAKCRIHLDKAFLESRPADDVTRQNILADLKEAAKRLDLSKLVANVPEENKDLADWLSLNAIPMTDFPPPVSAP